MCVCRRTGKPKRLAACGRGLPDHPVRRPKPPRMPDGLGSCGSQWLVPHMKVDLPAAQEPGAAWGKAVEVQQPANAHGERRRAGARRGPPARTGAPNAPAPDCAAQTAKRRRSPKYAVLSGEGRHRLVSVSTLRDEAVPAHLTIGVCPRSLPPGTPSHGDVDPGGAVLSGYSAAIRRWWGGRAEARCTAPSAGLPAAGGAAAEQGMGVLPSKARAAASIWCRPSRPSRPRRPRCRGPSPGPCRSCRHCRQPGRRGAKREAAGGWGAWVSLGPAWAAG